MTALRYMTGLFTQLFRAQAEPVPGLSGWRRAA
jgi:hypothetical protein